MPRNQILAIDQGTTSTRTILFDRHARTLRTERREFAQHYPQPGWVEHDPEDIWRDTLATARAANLDPETIAAIGITNQRETVVRMGQGVRHTHPQRHRLARSPYRPFLRRAARGWVRKPDS